ncbi:MAG: hypothetical protein IJ710_02505 [Prevotella sp.]|nr:hypothetical protein [Prevotella sp.]
MKHIIHYALLLALAVLPVKSAAQRAIVMSEQYATIQLQSSPAGAKVYHNGKLICTSTPATVQIPFRPMIMPGKKKDIETRLARSAEASSIRLLFVKDGYVQGEEVIRPSIRKEKGGFGSIINIDKSQYTFDWPQTVIHEFQAKPNSNAQAYRRDPTIPQGEARNRVSRDNAGQTDLERTIIRWFFDSDPKGARVFWRVISSIPAEVKNTNETYLGTTPFEETRSFNILGLTYENSRDVQIEVKLRRKGYMDQTKRFNVRQAIDQQEISSFFDLVKEDE